MRVYKRPNGVLALAPAKINLYLEILGKRSDGFHEIETVMAKIELFDTLWFETTRDDQLDLEVRSSIEATIPNDESNLIMKAARAIQAHSNVGKGAKIALQKRIPTEAGLGGGSSDAASTLLALNSLWNLQLSIEALHELAAGLGSDIPFFLYSSPLICRGRGERVEPLAIAGQYYLVVVKPPVQLSTALVYKEYQFTENQLATTDWNRLKNLDAIPPLNRLQTAASALTPWIDRLSSLFSSLGVCRHLMTGSGSAYFGICSSARAARNVAARVRQLQNVDVYCTRMCN